MRALLQLRLQGFDLLFRHGHVWDLAINRLLVPLSETAHASLSYGFIDPTLPTRTFTSA
jgi:hypothetical protein